MLPKEVGTLLSAISNSSNVTLDAQRLHAELTVLADLHQSLFDHDILTTEQKAVFRKWSSGSRGDLGLTAPAEGPPEIHLKITAPKGGVPPIVVGPKQTVVCPNCFKTFQIKT